MLKSQLPPLEPLVAFEAAARLLSFTAAARELNLTQAAISQQIRSLEDRLGVKLFIREHRAVRLSAAGLEYQHSVSALLRQLAGATADIRINPGRVRVTLATDMAFAHLFLLPRLTRFRRAHPDISLRLIASDDDADCTADDVQVAVLHGTGDWPGFHATALFSEEVFPVCSPGYWAQAARTEHLTEQTLIELEEVAQ